MTTLVRFLNHRDCRMQRMAQHWGALFVLFCFFLTLVGCGGGEDEFGPTVIRSAPNEAAPVAPVAKSAPVNSSGPVPDAGVADQAGRSVPPAGKPSAEIQASGGSGKHPPDVPETASSAENAEAMPATDQNIAGESGQNKTRKMDRFPVAGTLIRSSNDVAVFAKRDDEDLIVFDQYSGQEISRFRHSGLSQITALATSPDATLIIAGMANGSVQAFRSLNTDGLDVHARRMAAAAQRSDTGTRGHEGPVNQIVMLSESLSFASAGSDGKVCIWKLSTGRFQKSDLTVVRSFQSHPVEVLEMRRLRDERLMTVGADGVVRAWSLAEETAPEEIATLGPSVTAVTLSSDESLLAVAMEDGLVRFIRPGDPIGAAANASGSGNVQTETDKSASASAEPAETVAALRKPEIEHPSKVRCVAFSEDSRILMTGCDDGIVRLWDVATHKEVERTQEYGSEIVSVGFPTSTAGRRFVRSVVAMDATGHLQWWPSAANPDDVRRTRQLTRPVAQFRLTEFKSPSEVDVAVVSEPDSELEWLRDQLRVTTTQEQLAAHRSAIQRIQPSSELPSANAEVPARTASFSTAFDFKAGRNSRGVSDAVKLSFSADGSQLAAGRQQASSSRTSESGVYFWDLPTGTEVRRWEQIPGTLDRLHVAGRGRFIVTIPAAMKLTNCTGLTSAMNYKVAFLLRSPDDGHVVTGEHGTQQTQSPVLRLLESETLSEVAAFSSYESYPTAIAFSPDGETLMAGIRERKAHRLIAFETETLQQIQLLEEHDHDEPWLISDRVAGTKAITQILISPDGRQMLTCGEYGRNHFRVAMWTVRNGVWSEEKDRRVESRAAFMRSDVEIPARFLDSRGTRIILAQENGYRILDLDDKRVEREIKLAESGAGTGPISIAPDGSLMARGTEQGKVQLWLLDKEQPMLEFAAHLGPVVGLRFSPDSTHLATVGEENVVNVWSLADWVKRPRRLVRK